MNFMGKEPINPFLFYSGKIVGYIVWSLYITTFFKITNFKMFSILWLDYLSYVLFIVGSILAVISLVNLGKSTRFGLPVDNTVFKNKGIYRLSRNPMYVGFYLLTIASVLINANLIILLLSVYSISVYHLIIKAEEKFLEKRFGKEYLDYKRKVRRYL